MTDIELVIFDCDGVLVDSEIIVVRTELAFLADRDLHLSQEEFVHRFMGLPVKSWEVQLGELMFETTGSKPDAEFFRTLGQAIKHELAANLQPVPGIGPALASLSVPKCVASSSGTEALHWKLDHTRLAPHFSDGVYSTDLVQNGKPAPDLFLHAAKAQGFAARHCVVIEDSVNGVLAAKNAGMRVVGCTAGSHCLPSHGKALLDAGADLVLEHWAQLASVLTDIGN